MRAAPRTLLVLALTWLFLVGSAMPAQAQTKSFSLPEALIEARVMPDGTVRVVEHITYAFSGSFSGGYREIPLQREELSGEVTKLSISDIAVSESGREYSPGASAELGSSGDPDTFGVAHLGDRTRIVWHYEAYNETRTFDVSYTLRGLAIAYDDVVDVNLRVWGDEWEQELSVLRAELRWPGAAPGDTLIWGHPDDISGIVELKENGKGASLSASVIPPGRWVEMRAVFPRELLTTTSGALERSGPGLQKIIDEEGELARRAAEDRRRVQYLKDNVAWLLPLALLIMVLPGALIAFYIWRRYV